MQNQEKTYVDGVRLLQQKTVNQTLHLFGV